MDITLTPAFAVPIFSTQIGDFAAHQSALVEAVLAEQVRDRGLQLSNRYGWHSQGDFHRQGAPDVTWLMNQLGTFIRGALSSYDEMFTTAKIGISSCWANSCGQGGWNTPHNHMPSHWSGVVYLRAEECGEVGDPDDLGGVIEFLNPHPMGRQYGQDITSTFEPKDGLALLFPAYLLHYVHPNRQPQLRLSMSFNIEIAPV